MFFTETSPSDYPIYGVGTYTGTGPYTVTTNATSGPFINTDSGSPTTVELTIAPFIMNAAENTITDGVMLELVGPTADLWMPVTFSGTSCGSSTTCDGDFNIEGDVDGSDLAVLAADPGRLDLSAFSANFGRTDCLEISFLSDCF